MRTETKTMLIDDCGTNYNGLDVIYCDGTILATVPDWCLFPSDAWVTIAYEARCERETGHIAVTERSIVVFVNDQDVTHLIPDLERILCFCWNHMDAELGPHHFFDDWEPPHISTGCPSHDHGGTIR